MLLKNGKRTISSSRYGFRNRMIVKLSKRDVEIYMVKLANQVFKKKRASQISKGKTNPECTQFGKTEAEIQNEMINIYEKLNENQMVTIKEQQNVGSGCMEKSESDIVYRIVLNPLCTKQEKSKVLRFLNMLKSAENEFTAGPKVFHRIQKFMHLMKNGRVHWFEIVKNTDNTTFRIKVEENLTPKEEKRAKMFYQIMDKNMDEESGATTTNKIIQNILSMFESERVRKVRVFGRQFHEE